jgi:hypothetical protein
MWQFVGFFGKLGLYLIERANAQISWKMRLEYDKLDAYAEKRSEIETEIITSHVDWFHYFETCGFLAFPTEEDIEFTETLSNDDILTMLLVIINGLKGYIDRFEEDSPNCQKLYGFYKLLKEEIAQRPNLSYMPHGDGFKDYLSSREERRKIRDKKQSARIKGNICIFCESTNIRSNGNMWKCLSCGKSFRKQSNTLIP